MPQNGPSRAAVRRVLRQPRNLGPSAARNVGSSPAVAVIGGMVHRRSSTRPAPRILIVGGGFGGAYCAQAVERLLPVGEAEIALLDRNNYLMKMPGLARKARVALDWSMDLVFTKDAVELGLSSGSGRRRSDPGGGPPTVGGPTES